MTVAVAQPVSFWLLTAVLLAVLITQGVRGVHRRSALNRALHEIRRPLQTLALSVPEGATAGGGGGSIHSSSGRGPEITSGSVWQAISALGDLDRELNGGRPAERNDLVACRLLCDVCLRRCHPRARLAGAEIRLRWAGPDALIRGDGAALAAAIENLLMNAIEHGGSRITLNALTASKRLRLEVLDSGRISRGDSGDHSRGRFLPGPAGPQHGHGLKVAERVATEHGGRLNLEFSAEGSRAVLILPVNQAGASRDTPVRVRW